MEKVNPDASQARICRCGCGQGFIPTRPWQKYVNAAHKSRAYRKRSESSLWYVSLTEARKAVDEELEECRVRIRQKLLASRPGGRG